jgi:ubiquinone/menaquinone biosynthesis C-methylase UbiE
MSTPANAMSAETKVATHYGRKGLEDAILAAVAREGKDPEKLTALDLAPVDEFHVGGIESTQELAAHMELRPSMRLLDVGSGIGGPARYFAEKHCCEVTGVDLTPEFVQVANNLTRRLKLNHLAEFRQASALDLPFEPNTFDGAYMLHVGMNIADKPGIFRQVRRVLKVGSLFTVFDILFGHQEPGAKRAIQFPVPWAVSEETSFVGTVKEYRDALQRAGFAVEQERARTEFAIAFMERAMARIAQGGPPVLGLQLLIGDKTPAMMNSMLAMLKEGVLQPVELYARAV